MLVDKGAVGFDGNLIMTLRNKLFPNCLGGTAIMSDEKWPRDGTVHCGEIAGSKDLLNLGE